LLSYVILVTCGNLWFSAGGFVWVCDLDLDVFVSFDVGSFQCGDYAQDHVSCYFLYVGV